jgi:hypothetical protein
VKERGKKKKEGLKPLLDCPEIITVNAGLIFVLAVY